MAGDFLAAERAIRERLQDVEGIQAVYGAEDAQSMEERAQRTPCVHVIYAGAEPVETHGRGDVVRFGQTWTLVLSVRHLGRDPGNAREAAGELLYQIIRTVSGWKPGREFTAMVPVRSTLRTDYGGGFAYLPVSFQTTMTIR